MFGRRAGLAGLLGALAGATAAVSVYTTDLAHAAMQIGTDPRQLFTAGNEAYRAGRYEEAARAYRTILQSGLAGGSLYYNLGNALLKSSKRGEAVWAYLEAERFLPRDADVRSNLAYARSLLPSADASSIAPGLVVRLLMLGGQCSTSELALAWTVLLWTVLLCWTLRRWHPTLRRSLTFVCWTATCASLFLLAALLAQTIWVDGMPAAVTVEDNVAVKFSPQDSGTTHFTLPEGAFVQLLQRQPPWVQIRRRDGRAGWLPDHAVMLF